MLNVRKQMENVVNARLPKDQLLAGHENFKQGIAGQEERSYVHTGDFQDHHHYSIQQGESRTSKP
jgi:hypothetical protein